MDIDPNILRTQAAEGLAPKEGSPTPSPSGEENFVNVLKDSISGMKGFSRSAIRTSWVFPSGAAAAKGTESTTTVSPRVAS